MGKSHKRSPTQHAPEPAEVLGMNTFPGVGRWQRTVWLLFPYVPCWSTRTTDSTAAEDWNPVIALCSCVLYGVFVCVCIRRPHTCVWRPEVDIRNLSKVFYTFYSCVLCTCMMYVRGQLAGVVLLFHHVDPRNHTPVVGLGGRHFYLLGHLASLPLFFFFETVVLTESIRLLA